MSVEVSPNKVKAGDSVSITVIAKNKGATNDSFDFSVYCDSRFLGTLGISDLDAGGEEKVTFSWSTKDLAEGNYTIKAVASQVLWETDTSNNAYVYEHLMVTPEQSFPFMLTVAVVVLAAFASFMLLKKKR